jgi:hypothetical protein
VRTSELPCSTTIGPGVVVCGVGAACNSDTEILFEIDQTVGLTRGSRTPTVKFPPRPPPLQVLTNRSETLTSRMQQLQRFVEMGQTGEQQISNRCTRLPYQPSSLTSNIRYTTLLHIHQESKSWSSTGPVVNQNDQPNAAAIFVVDDSSW